MSAITVTVGMTIIDASENAASLADVTLLGNVVITQDSGTPPGDPVVVDLSNFAGISALSSLTVQNGATVKVGAGLLGVTAGQSLTINGGTLEVEGSLIGAGALNTINVGP